MPRRCSPRMRQLIETEAEVGKNYEIVISLRSFFVLIKIMITCLPNTYL